MEGGDRGPALQRSGRRIFHLESSSSPFPESRRGAEACLRTHPASSSRGLAQGPGEQQGARLSKACGAGGAPGLYSTWVRTGRIASWGHGRGSCWRSRPQLSGQPSFRGRACPGILPCTLASGPPHSGPCCPAGDAPVTSAPALVASAAELRVAGRRAPPCCRRSGQQRPGGGAQTAPRPCSLGAEPCVRVPGARRRQAVRDGRERRGHAVSLAVRLLLGHFNPLCAPRPVLETAAQTGAHLPRLRRQKGHSGARMRGLCRARGAPAVMALLPPPVPSRPPRPPAAPAAPAAPVFQQSRISAPRSSRSFRIHYRRVSRQ